MALRARIVSGAFKKRVPRHGTMRDESVAICVLRNRGVDYLIRAT